MLRLAVLSSILFLSTAVQAVTPNAQVRSVPPSGVVQSSKYRSEEVAFTNSAAHVTLAGTLTIPLGPGPFPAVVLLSDMGAQDRDGTARSYRPLLMLADYLSQQGIAVLRFDDRGVGKSEGDNAATTTAERVKDAQAAVAFLRARPDMVPTRIGLIGHGEGGNVA
ncbi:alpha/beta hydrolase family protein [Hymenobacter sp. AT01-02]|uniref:alpha/beta hydrolase family protein n=1 Tax=Hymenobacter sp. AT01-02 TaxID=1571877 RepID=UPI0005F0D08B|nr:alpha/beta hydrolase [Hymenobacter sp. AT01-02]